MHYEQFNCTFNFIISFHTSRMRDLFLLAFAVLVCTQLVSGKLTGPIDRPLELVIRRNILEGRCIAVSFGETQPHKGLYLADYVLEKSPVPHPEGGWIHQVLRFISYDRVTLLSQARLECPNDSFETHESQAPSVSGTSQVSFSPEARNEFDAVDLPPLEVIPLVTSGPPRNRVDLAFFSDGYTVDEREKFIQDATRLAQDLSANQTFHTVKPLMNFWAVFSPSKESGVGVGGKPKELGCSYIFSTVFGLYRDGTELRGLYSSKSDVALGACASLHDRCDYAILLGNDPLYGGIGGEYTSVTASLANGALVLRHEIGHSIIDVGEEYDGGYAYFGVNAAEDVSSVTWSHWLTNPETIAPPREERSVMPMQAYPWTLLNITTPWSHTFSSSGTYSRYLVKFSLSGIPEKKDLDVVLDGVNLNWTPRKDIGIDRWHYNIEVGKPLSPGFHEIKFIFNNKRNEGRAQLCSVEFLEFGTASEFNSTLEYYGAFPTFDMSNQTTYRPTYEGCLMRNVAYPNFCKVCLEGLWMSLLKRVDLIDNDRESCAWKPALIAGVAGHWKRTVELELVPLAHLRKDPASTKESYTITWSKDGEVMQALANQTQIVVDDVLGTYEANVELATDGVRVDRHGWLTAGRTFVFASRCADIMQAGFTPE
ncbi:hypothetical protein BV22DRAFT_1098340, partial [Leucogyrophana mollusca]